MRKVIGGLCCLIVALQVLVAVPLAVCCAFYFFVAEGGAPIVVELHSGQRLPATVAPADYPLPPPLAAASATTALAPPRNIIPDDSSPPPDHPILTTRQIQGSPLAGTVLETDAPPQEEQQLFLAALEKAALTCTPQPLAELASNEVVSLATACAESSQLTSCQPEAKETVQRLLAHLYEMAELDEQASEYERADQWRALARELRSHDDQPLE
jgi:hypothetical protein